MVEMERDILYSGAIEDPASVEERQSDERSVASRSPCDEQERTSVATPVTEVVPPPSVCSTADGPPRRTSPPPGRHPPLARTTFRRTVNVGCMTQTGEIRTYFY